SDGNSRLIMSSAAAGQPVEIYCYNSTSQRFGLTQVIPPPSSSTLFGFAMDLTRDGRSLAISSDDDELWLFKLDTLDASQCNATYVQVQTIVSQNTSIYTFDYISFDAYGTALLVSSFNDWPAVYRVFPEDDPDNFGLLTLESIIQTPGNVPFISIYSIKLAGNGTSLFVDGVLSSPNPINQVYYSNYELPTWEVLVPALPQIHSPLLTSDFGEVVAAVNNSLGGTMSLFTWNGTAYSFWSTVPYPPWDQGEFGVQYISATNSYGLSTDCTTLAVGHFIPFGSGGVLNGTGVVVVYRTNLQTVCSSAIVPPPFTPPPPPVPPPIEPPLLPPLVPPIKSPPISPAINKNTPPSDQQVTSPTTAVAPETASALSITLLVFACVLTVAVAIIVTCVIYARMKKVNGVSDKNQLLKDKKK